MEIYFVLIEPREQHTTFQARFASIDDAVAWYAQKYRCVEQVSPDCIVLKFRKSVAQ